MTDADTLSGEITQAVICVLQDRGLVPSDDSADGRWYSPEDWYAIALASHAVTEFLRWGVR